ncbi:MAG: class I SAM-dependent RNA methyltransferase [Spirochaetaceae bacterium]|nr:class I SAM-dependent RNA methyltransferase [Spirochaetaceae bacterium]
MVEAGRVVRLGVERIVPGGDGIGRVDGRACFVPLSAPGDLLEARVTEARPDYVRAEIVSVLEPGPGRVEPRCPYYGACGGCNLQHLSYEAQLEAKLGIARDAWLRVGRAVEAGFTIVPSAPFGYRNRAQFRYDGSGRPCYARRASNELLAVDSCPILAAPLERWLSGSAGAEPSLPAKAGRSTFEAKPGLPAGAEPGKRFVAFGQDAAPGSGAAPGTGRAYIEGVDDEAVASILGRSFRFATAGFFQSNLAMVERLVPAAVSGFSEDAKGDAAADLYCGVGLFGAFLSGSFRRLVCVEQERRSIGYACVNVPRGASFSAMRIEDWTRSAQARERFDLVVVDPPRSGLGPAVRSWLASSRPSVVSYVSCDPVSLARDAGFLVDSGYTVESAELYDFYPQTSHIESHVRFRVD